MAIITGVVELDGSPHAATVRAYRASDGSLAGETTSDAGDGSYTLSVPLGGQNYYVMAINGDGVRPRVHGPILTAADASNDPYFANVVTLLHFDGTDGVKTFTDVTGRTWGFGGDVQIDTGQSKFGGASGLFDGSGDYIYSADSDDWHLDGDFTIESFIRPGSIGVRQFICGQSDVGASQARSFFEIAADGRLKFYPYFPGSVEITSAAALTPGIWYHIAVAREGTTNRLFIGGINNGAVQYTDPPTNYASPFSIGRLGQYSGLYFGGHIDEFRVTKGVARYTNDFTPPTSPFPDA